jgi:SpoVK/Ycf46/Vps4 family AAA+-type ATPase
MNNNIYIAERFKKVIYLHLVKNMLTHIAVRPPLLLGIHGSSGDGKTYQCEYLLEQMGVKTFLISGGQLESHDAGEPAQLVRTTYLNASRNVEKGESKAAVVLINDIDTGIGSWGEMVQYTVNRQTVFGELMHLVDYPTSVEGRTTRRIPIIITGNDFTKLYEPLVRAGRMTSFEWKPTIDEKVHIVSRIFPELSPAECKEVVSTFHSEPVAFFSFLRSTLIDEKLYGEIERLGVLKVITLTSEGREPDIRVAVQYQNIIDAGHALIASGQLANHLQRS